MHPVMTAGQSETILTGPSCTASILRMSSSNDTPVSRATSRHPMPSEYMATARSSRSSLASCDSFPEAFHLCVLQRGHMAGLQPPRGIQRCPHFTHDTSVLVWTFHSADLQDGHLRGAYFPRLLQTYPHTMHRRFASSEGALQPSLNDIPQ